MDTKETLRPDPAKPVTPPEQTDFPPVRESNEERLHAQAHDAGVEAVARALDQMA